MDFGNQFGGQPTQSTGVLNLAKGGVLDLNKVAPALKHVILGCGWDVASNGPTADLDLSAILVPKGARITQQNAMEHVVFYNNQAVQGVHSTGDNRTGIGEGDDEQIIVDLDLVAPNIEKIIFIVTIFDSSSLLLSLMQQVNAKLSEWYKTHLLAWLTKKQMMKFVVMN